MSSKLIRNQLPNSVMDSKIYLILDAADRPLLEQTAGTAHEALAAAKLAFPQFANRMRVSVPKQKPELENHHEKPCNTPQRGL